MELGDKESRTAAQLKRFIEKLEVQSNEHLSMVANKLASWPKRTIERQGTSGLVLDGDAHSAD
jgi:hypothetical protein